MEGVDEIILVFAEDTPNVTSVHNASVSDNVIRRTSSRPYVPNMARSLPRFLNQKVFHGG